MVDLEERCGLLRLSAYLLAATGGSIGEGWGAGGAVEGTLHRKVRGTDSHLFDDFEKRLIREPEVLRVRKIHGLTWFDPARCKGCFDPTLFGWRRKQATCWRCRGKGVLLVENG